MFYILYTIPFFKFRAEVGAAKLETDRPIFTVSTVNFGCDFDVFLIHQIGENKI